MFELFIEISSPIISITNMTNTNARGFFQKLIFKCWCCHCDFIKFPVFPALYFECLINKAFKKNSPWRSWVAAEEMATWQHNGTTLNDSPRGCLITTRSIAFVSSGVTSLMSCRVPLYLSCRVPLYLMLWRHSGTGLEGVAKNIPMHWNWLV